MKILLITLGVFALSIAAIFLGPEGAPTPAQAVLPPCATDGDADGDKVRDDKPDWAPYDSWMTADDGDPYTGEGDGVDDCDPS